MHYGLFSSWNGDAAITDQGAALMEAAAAETHASRRLELWASLVRRQMQTTYDVISIHRQAAASDP